MPWKQTKPNETKSHKDEITKFESVVRRTSDSYLSSLDPDPDLRVVDPSDGKKNFIFFSVCMSVSS